MPETAAIQNSPSFIEKFQGRFYNMLRWEQLDTLWSTVRQQRRDWYIYAPGETVPEQTVSHDKLNEFLDEIDGLLHREHTESYCGIVYCDNPDEPSLVKIYDPNNLGSVCGSSSLPPPLPGWILSTLPPIDLPSAFPTPNNRRRWWKKLFN